MVIVGGGLQVGLTTLAVLGVCLALGYNSFQGIFIGFVLAQSSTSIVLQNLRAGAKSMRHMAGS